jgi:hypothetical protein
MSEARTGPTAALQSLGMAAVLPGAAESAISRHVRAWLLSPAATGTLWVRGAPGTGRTHGVALALESLRSEGVHAKRVACWRGSPLEEALEEIAVFLRQLGSDVFASTLAQRSFTAAKLSVLFQGLEAARAVLWLDDVDELLVEPAAGGWPQQGSVAALLRSCAALAGRHGRAILVSRDVELPGMDRVEVCEGEPTARRSPGEVEGAVQALSEPGRKLLQALARAARPCGPRRRRAAWSSSCAPRRPSRRSSSWRGPG